MNIEFVDSEVEKIEKKIKVQFSARADNEEISDVSETIRKRKSSRPNFKVGDIFNIKDKKYVIISVEKKLLILVIANDWRKEGYASPEEARSDYKTKGYFGEKIVNGKPTFIGDDDFLTYMFTYEFTPLSLDEQIAKSQAQQIEDRYKEKAAARKLQEKERKKDESWIKSNPEYFRQIMSGIEVSDLKKERQWRQWEKFSRRKIH